MIVAGTGYVGHAQRFCAVVKGLWDKQELQGKTGVDIAKLVSGAGVNDFGQTIPGPFMKEIEYSALVAYVANDQPFLCELFGRLGFQPELKDPDDLWFTSTGAGQAITDPFLALLRQVYWSDGPPNVQGGIFTAYWALDHACVLNPGGINKPIRIAVLARRKGKFVARTLEAEELEEHSNMIGEATRHMARFKAVLEGEALDNKDETPPAPTPPAKGA